MGSTCQMSHVLGQGTNYGGGVKVGSIFIVVDPRLVPDLYFINSPNTDPTQVHEPANCRFLPTTWKILILYYILDKVGKYFGYRELSFFLNSENSFLRKHTMCNIHDLSSAEYFSFN